jgi:hypothetical protein
VSRFPPGKFTIEIPHRLHKKLVERLRDPEHRRPTVQLDNDEKLGPIGCFRHRGRFLAFTDSDYGKRTVVEVL